MPQIRLVDNEKGVALITVVLVALAVSSLAVAASMMTMGGALARKYSERVSIADQAATAGVEKGLSALLGNDSLYPTTGYTTLEDSLPVYDASGNPIDGVWRSTYLGPSADPSQGSVVSEVWTRGGVRSVKRLEVAATSLARFAYMVNNSFSAESNFNSFGPLHTNGSFTVWSPMGTDSATFLGDVTAVGTVNNPSYGSFRKGYTNGASSVTMPTSADLTVLRPLAVSAGLQWGSTSMGPNSAPMRLEFVPVDMDGDTLTTNDVEGFVRVYVTSDLAGDRDYVIARVGFGTVLDTPNCGVWDAGLSQFQSVDNGRLPADTAEARVDANLFRCYLGGDVTLNDSTWAASIGPGSWVAYTGPAISSPGFDTIPGKQFLHPYTKGVNSNSAGVIYVDGDVAVSGVVAGKVTVVAQDDIIIADDIVLHTNPAENDCDSDMLGLIALDDVVMASNTLNLPQRYDVTEPFHTMSATKDEHVHAVILALNQFRTYNPHASPIGGDAGAETCEGVAWGRGCLYLIGGLIQGSWGDLGENGRGYDLRASYNSCVRESAPPQFPATRDFSRKRVVEMNGATFNVANWFADYQS